jgi:hypothetical protein
MPESRREDVQIVEDVILVVLVGHVVVLEKSLLEKVEK